MYQPDRTRARLDTWTETMRQQRQPAITGDETIRSLHENQSTRDNVDTDDIHSTALEHEVSSKRSMISNLLDWIMFWIALLLFRIYLKQCIDPRLARSRANQVHQDRRNQRQRFRQWVTRLNRQRENNGQRPLSMESLSLVLRDRDLLDGEDYDGLLQFDEEAGPAVEALLNSVGATQEEIDRCPLRVLTADDDLILRNHHPNNDTVDTMENTCPICLEAFVINDIVRTIPCFHTFHKQCVDPWLSHRAICPVCKYNAVG